MTNPRVSVVIPTVDREDQVYELLCVLQKQTFNNFEIVIVDQTSKISDKVLSFVEQNKPVVKLIQDKIRNLPRARNLGVKNSLGEVVLFLDDDVIPNNDLIQRHIENYTNIEIGGVGGKTTGGYDHKVSPRNVGKFRNFDGKVIRGFSSDVKKEVDHLSGGNMSFRRKVFSRIGFFNERFGGAVSAGEETDFCLRARKAGFKLVYEPKAVVRHLWLRTGGCRDEKFKDFIFWHGHNWILFARSHMNTTAQIISTIQRIIRFFSFTLLKLNPFLVLKGFEGIAQGVKDLRKTKILAKVYPQKNEIKNILVMRLGGIGELLTVTPALRAVRERFKNAKITLIVEGNSYPVVKDSGLIDDVIIADRVFRAETLYHIFSSEFLLELRKLAKIIRAKKYDIFLCFQHLYFRRSILKPLLITAITRIPRRVGFDSLNRGFFLTDKVPDRRMEVRHLLYRNREFLRPLGIDLQDFSAAITIKDKDKSFAKKFVEELNPRSEELLIGINPGSSRPATRWDKEKFAQLIERICWNYPARVVIVGTKEEYELCEQVRRYAKASSYNLAGKTTLGEVSGLIPYFSLFITNDTGPLHIAYHLKVLTIGIFRPGEYPIWGSYQEIDRFKAIYKEVDCAPCYKFECEDHECMKQITVEDVYKPVQSLLETKSPSKSRIT